MADAAIDVQGEGGNTAVLVVVLVGADLLEAEAGTSCCAIGVGSLRKSFHHIAGANPTAVDGFHRGNWARAVVDASRIAGLG
jgi:hypothetical protein